MAGLVFTPWVWITVKVPLAGLQFQAKPLASAGRLVVVKVPVRLAAVNNL